VEYVSRIAGGLWVCLSKHNFAHVGYLLMYRAFLGHFWWCLSEVNSCLHRMFVEI